MPLWRTDSSGELEPMLAAGIPTLEKGGISEEFLGSSDLYDHNSRIMTIIQALNRKLQPEPFPAPALCFLARQKPTA